MERKSFSGNSQNRGTAEMPSCSLSLLCAAVLATLLGAVDAAYSASDPHDLVGALSLLTPGEVLSVLREAGYADVALEETPDDNAFGGAPEVIVESHRARVCETVVKHAGEPSRADAPSFIEEAARKDDPPKKIKPFFKLGTPYGVGMSPADTGLGLPTDEKRADCTCTSFDCTCKKQCYCTITSVDPPKTMVPGPGGAKQAGVAGLPDHYLKCVCAFDGFGGGGEGSAPGTSLECDCKPADCTCRRNCLCTPPDEFAESAEASHAWNKSMRFSSKSQSLSAASKGAGFQTESLAEGGSKSGVERTDLGGESEGGLGGLAGAWAGALPTDGPDSPSASDLSALEAMGLAG
jgi:hypothetical protein